MTSYSENDEWLEADGLGGFASGTATGIRTRRYHALLLTATTPPTGRMVLVNGCDAWFENASGSFALTSQRYEPGVVHPDGASRVTEFSLDPWPRWIYTLADGTTIAHEVIARHGSPVVALSWRVLSGSRGSFSVRPFFSGRDYHSLHHENASFRFEPESTERALVWRPYEGVPTVRVVTNGEYHHQPEWYRNFRYERERDRELDSVEDLAAPGILRFSLDTHEAVMILSTEALERTDAVAALADIRSAESTRRAAFASPLHRGADAYLVKRGTGQTIIAGYPWFSDWGRDTFIGLRGICLATDRLEEATRILVEWTQAISEGMLPNRFPDRGELPEFNSVDASLWFIVAVYDLFDAAERRGTPVSADDRRALEDGVDQILSGYAHGTRYGIRADEDGLLAAGVEGVQLTWMDAKVGEHVITPRVGKPVEIQALWLNSLWLASGRSPRWRELFDRGRVSFEAKFWNESTGFLHDVVDVDHQAGTIDASLRPNQIFALGGLPLVLVDASRARRAIDIIEARLWTPVGLRSLASSEPGYAGHYAGGVAERDGRYHQGTVWPWLLTAFVEAWTRCRGKTASAIADARTRFLAPLVDHLDEAGLGHVSEIADGDAPHRPNGCPFQAWSVGEALRLDLIVLRSPTASNRRRRKASKSAEGAAHEMGV
jgi:predicted glycogen debranching enzyme